MNFESAYKKVQEGTASEEEVAFIAQELDKLRKISEILDNPAVPAPLLEAETEQVEHAKKRFNKKTTIKIISVTFVSLLVIAALVCGIIFIPSCSSAAKNCRLGREECVALAEKFIADMAENGETTFVLREVDKELRIPNGLNDAIYVYEIDFVSSYGVAYTVEVSTKSGYVILTDIDYH